MRKNAKHTVSQTKLSSLSGVYLKHYAKKTFGEILNNMLNTAGLDFQTNTNHTFNP